MHAERAHIARLRADVAAAERALRDLEYSDDLAHVTGSWDRAHQLLLRCRRELIQAQTALVVDACEAAAS